LTLPIAVQIINNQMNEIQKFKARIAELEASLRVDVSAIPN
jgi:hypothetical protein